MTSAEFIQFGQQIANLHRCRIEDAPGSGGSPALRRGQATVERLPYYGGDGCTALPRESANSLVALIVNENLQPVGQHAHTLACIYGRDRVLPRGPPPLNAQFRGHVVGGGVVLRTRWRPAESRCDADASRTEWAARTADPAETAGGTSVTHREVRRLEGALLCPRPVSSPDS